MSGNIDYHGAPGPAERANILSICLGNRDRQLQAAQEQNAQLCHQIGMKDLEIAYWKAQVRTAEQLHVDNERLRKIADERKALMKMSGSWDYNRHPFGPPRFDP